MAETGKSLEEIARRKALKREARKLSPEIKKLKRDMKRHGMPWSEFKERITRVARAIHDA
jgi:hypothetical protein